MNEKLFISHSKQEIVIQKGQYRTVYYGKLIFQYIQIKNKINYSNCDNQNNVENNFNIINLFSSRNDITS
jgi:hypothetical protein